MIARLPHHRISLDPLIAEAKRRARQRRVLILLLVLALAGGGTGLVFGGLAVYRAATAARAPYESRYLVGQGSGPAVVINHHWTRSVSLAPGGGAWIVGDSLAWRWDGTTWRGTRLPNLHNPGGLESVANVSRNDAWAVGEVETGGEVGSRGLIEHWDGARWSLVRGHALRASNLSSVSAAGPRNVWAAGATDQPGKAFPLLLHWTGASWRRQALPWSHSGWDIEHVVAIGDGQVWVVVRQSGRYLDQVRAAFWNGEHWRFVPAPFGSRDPLLSFAASAWNDAWAVGSYRSGNLARSLAAHWDGRDWRVVSVPEAPGYNDSVLDGLADVGPADAWAVGKSNVSENGSVTTPVPVYFHWDGTSWRLMPGAAPSLGWTDLSIAAGRGSAWVIGNCRSDNIVLHWTRGRWSVVPHPRDVYRLSGHPAARREKLCTPSG